MACPGFENRSRFFILPSKSQRIVPCRGMSFSATIRAPVKGHEMPHDTPLIATIVIGLGLAFVFGAIVQRFRIPPIVGYLRAGVAVGPFTPDSSRTD